MLSITITNNKKNTCLHFPKYCSKSLHIKGRKRDGTVSQPNAAYQMSPCAFQINTLQKPKIPNVNWANERNLKEVLFEINSHFKM